MKRFIYIAVVAVGFLAVSCSKETIKPTVQNDQEVPVWKAASSDPSNDGDTNGTGEITDPNNDKDESSKKKVN